MIGRTLGHYQLLEKIGSGGMGVVYRARDERLERDVAVKILPSGLLSDEAARRRFRQEALALSQFNHSNITTAHDFDNQDGIDFLVMEYVPGSSLDRKLTGGALSIDTVLALARQLAAGLAAAHAHGVIHRDLKPGNLRLTPDGRLKILDFGLAKFMAPARGGDGDATVTQKGQVAGTLAYMPPEQLRGGAVDERSDIYAAGAVLYELTTGQRVFGPIHGADLISAILNQAPPPPGTLRRDMPAPLGGVLLKCLEKDPDRRYPSAAALLSDLERPAAHVPRRWPRWNWRIGAAIALLMLVVIAFLWRTRPAPIKPAPKPITLAVLPFRVLSGEDAKYLSIGIPYALITRVANIGQIRVRSTNSILHYENQNVEARDAGRALDCDYLLAGTVQSAGDRFRVNVQLLRTGDASAVWGKVYDLPRSDLLGLQDSVAEQVVTALRIQLTSAERERVYRRYTQNAAAYDLYLQGRSELLRRHEMAAVQKFEESLRIDPNYALAHAGLAIAFGLIRIGPSRPADVAQWERRSTEEARKALELDPNLAEAHEAMAAVYRWSEFDWDRVIEECNRALELNPSLYIPHRYRADAFRHLGLLDLVAPEIQAARENNPGPNRDDAIVVAAAVLWDGRFREVEEAVRQAHGVGGVLRPELYLAQAWFYLGQIAQAEAMAAELHADTAGGKVADAVRASFLAARGQRREAETLLASATARELKSHHLDYAVGVTYAQLGNQVEAVRWLRAAANAGFVCYPWYARDPLLKPLRGYPPFEQLEDDLRKNWETAKVRFGSHTTAPAR